MKVKASLVIILVILCIFIGHNLIIFKEKNDMNVLLLPSLPKPIAKEYALITSAGQCTDSYIINDIANQLMIHNYFVPQAEEQDLDGINTLVFVVGYSSLGTKLHDISSDDEENRIKKLINKSKKEDKVIITVFIGGKQRRVDKADMLLKLVCSESDYIIGTKEANYDNLISDLAKSNRIPLTLINGVNDISEPFASAFR